MIQQEVDDMLTEIANEQEDATDTINEQEMKEPASSSAGRTERPEFEDVGSPSKIPRTRPDMRDLDQECHLSSEQKNVQTMTCALEMNDGMEAMKSAKEMIWIVIGKQKKEIHSRKLWFYLPPAFVDEEAEPPQVDGQEVDDVMKERERRK